MIAAVAGSFAVFMLAVAVFGFGQGIYMAVDLALASAVLPDPNTSAKDMGVLNIANALPQSLIPIIAPLILAVGASGSKDHYPSLFFFGAVCGVLGAAAVRQVRGVR